MGWSIAFPVAGIEINPLWPPLVAFVISFFTSMGGVSGAFLLLPFQVSVLGFTTPAVSATNHLYNIVAIPGGVLRFIREGRMVWPLTAAVVIGTLPGVMIGAVIRVRWLPDPRDFKLFAGLVLLYIGGRMLQAMLRRGRGGPTTAPGGDIARVERGRFGMRRVTYEYDGRRFEASTPVLLCLCAGVGLLGGVYGIGGGAIVAPFLVTRFGLPVHTVAGAALMGTFITSLAGVAFFQLMASTGFGVNTAPDWGLGLLFGLGGLAGTWCGARVQKHVPARTIKWILVVCILVPAVRYIAGFFL